MVRTILEKELVGCKVPSCRILMIMIELKCLTSENRMVQTAARFKQNMSRSKRVNAVKRLRREGYK